MYRRLRLLDHDHSKKIVLGVLNEELRGREALCVGFVLMPDHVHGIIWFPQAGSLSGFMHGWKRKSSFHIRSWYRRAKPSYFENFGEGDRFWQPRYYSFEIYERAKLEEKRRYMHENPVRAGLVERSSDWRLPIHWIE